MQLAKQSTAANLLVGPVLDSTGAEYTGLVIGDLSIAKHDATTLTALASAATLTHLSNGVYSLVLTTGNTDTLGRCKIVCTKSTYQCPPLELEVLPAATYDALVTNAAGGLNGLPLSKASNVVDANVISVGPTGANTTQTARDLGASVLLSVGTGTGQVNLASGKVPATLASTDVTGNVAADLQTIKTQTVTCAGGVTVPAATLASTANITAGTITTVTNLTNAPTAGDFTAAMKTSLNSATPAVTVSDKTGFSLANGSFVTATFGTCDLTSTMKTSVTTAATAATPTAAAVTGAVGSVTAAVTLPSIPSNWITAAGIASGALVVAVWDGAISGHTGAGSFGAALSAAGGAGDPWTTTLPGSYIAGQAGYIVGTLLDAAISSRGTSTLTQTQVTGGAYALNSSSFAFNAALDFTTTQKAATLARVTLVDTTTTNTDMRGTNSAALASAWTGTLATNLGTLAGHDPGATLASTTNITAASGVALTSAYDFAKGTVAMVESYNVNGSARRRRRPSRASSSI